MQTHSSRPVSAHETPLGCPVPAANTLVCRTGKVIHKLADLPLAEDIPIAFNSCRQGPRSVGWRSDKPAELVWTEAQVSPPCCSRPCCPPVTGHSADLTELAWHPDQVLHVPIQLREFCTVCWSVQMHTLVHQICHARLVQGRTQEQRCSCQHETAQHFYFAAHLLLVLQAEHLTAQPLYAAVTCLNQLTSIKLANMSAGWLLQLLT